MMSNDQSSYENKPYPRHQGDKLSANDDTIRTEKIQIERKTFILTLKENPRGRFLRITEDVGGRRDTIILPATGLEDFLSVLQNITETYQALPPEPEHSDEG